jgi:hypothetical protein
MLHGQDTFDVDAEKHLYPSLLYGTNYFELPNFEFSHPAM